MADGRFVYVAMAGRNELAGFAVDIRTGLLRRMPEVAVALDGTPESVMVDGERRVLKVLLSSGESRTYGMDPVQGRLTPVAPAADAAARGDPAASADPAGRPVHVAMAHVCALPASGLRGIAADPDGNHAFAVRDDAHAILTYRIDKASGRCASAAQSRAEGGARPLAIVLVPLKRAIASAN